MLLKLLREEVVENAQQDQKGLRNQGAFIDTKGELNGRFRYIQ